MQSQSVTPQFEVPVLIVYESRRFGRECANDLFRYSESGRPPTTSRLRNGGSTLGSCGA